MKKTVIFGLFLLTAVFFGCGNDNVRILHKHYQYEKTFFETHKIEFDIYLENVGYSRKVTKLVEKLVFENMNFDKFAAHIENSFIENHTSDDYPLVFNDDGTEYVYNSYLSENFNVIFHDEAYIIMQNNYYYIYSGMPHGFFLTNFYVIDVKKKSHLEVSDLFNPIPDDILKEIIESDYEIENYLRDNIWPPDTINIQQDSIELIWNIYQIAPYYLGWIWIEIPDTVSEQYITDKGRDIWKRK